MAGRRFRQALKNCLFEGMDIRGDELEQARQEFTNRYGEAQMVLPDAVLGIANVANKRLAEAYGKVKTSQQPGDPRLSVSEREKLEAFIEREVAPVLWQLHQAMRRDLGVSDQQQAFDPTAAASLEDSGQISGDPA
jgi:hypothetical protein